MQIDTDGVVHLDRDDVTVHEEDDGSIVISWNPVPGATAYRIPGGVGKPLPPEWDD